MPATDSRGNCSNSSRALRVYTTAPPRKYRGAGHREQRGGEQSARRGFRYCDSFARAFSRAATSCASGSKVCIAFQPRPA